MGIGFALGGIAKGITDQQELGQKRQALALQTANLQSDNAYRNAMLGLEGKRIDAAAGVNAQNQAQQLYTGLLSNVKDIITKSLEAGTPVEKVAEAIKPQLAYMQSIAPVAGIDPTAAAAQVQGLLQSGIRPTQDKIGTAWEAVQQKIAAGQPLTAGEMQLRDLKISENKALFGGAGGDLPPEAGAAAAAPVTPPAAPAPAAPAEASAAPAAQPEHPPVPANLIGKAIAWSAKTQRFYDKAGNAYNQQGVPVPQ